MCWKLFWNLIFEKNDSKVSLTMEIRITENFYRIKKSADFKTEWSQRKKLKKVNNKQVYFWVLFISIFFEK